MGREDWVSDLQGTTVDACEASTSTLKYYLRIGYHFKTRKGVSGQCWAWASLSGKSWQRAAADKELWFVHWGLGVRSLSCWLMKSLVWSNSWHTMVSGTNGLCLGWGKNTPNPACSEHSALRKPTPVLHGTVGSWVDICIDQRESVWMLQMLWEMQYHSNVTFYRSLLFSLARSEKFPEFTFFTTWNKLAMLI